MSVQDCINEISTVFDESFIYDASLLLFREVGSNLLGRSEANLPYLIYSDLEDAIFDARSSIRNTERAHFLEILEIMSWAMYNSWASLAEQSICCGESAVNESLLDREKIIMDFRGNLNCKEGEFLRQYLAR